MKIEGLKVVLDTNIILSAISRLSPYRKVIDAFDIGKFNLCLNYKIVLEYEELLTRHFGNETSRNFLKSLAAAPNVYVVKRWFHMDLITADADDDKFVDYAFACNAHFIVSNDKHFNVLNHIDFPSITVMKMNEFMNLLDNS